MQFKHSLIAGYDFFISHKRSEAAYYAEALAAALGAHGFQCFLDREETPAGIEFSPAIARSLRRSRFLVLVATPGAVTSMWVRKELAAFNKRRDRIVTINDGVTLPSAATETAGLDWLNERSWIDETIGAVAKGALGDSVLKDVIRAHKLRRARSTSRMIGGAVVAMLLILMLLASYWWIRSQREQIDAALTADNAGGMVPTDLRRRAFLEELRGRAMWRLFGDRVQEIEKRLSRIPTEDARHVLLPPSDDRTELSVHPRGGYLVLGRAERLELFDIASGSVNSTLDLHSIEAPTPAVAEQGADDDQPPVPRMPAKLVRMEENPARGVLLVEVEYALAALPEDANDKRRLIEEHEPSYEFLRANYGMPEMKEREVLALGLSGPPWQSLGMTRRLTEVYQHDADGEEHGFSWIEVDSGSRDQLWKRLSGLPPGPGARLRSALKERGFDPTTRDLDVRFLAADPRVGAVIVQVIDRGSHDDPAGVGEQSAYGVSLELIHPERPIEMLDGAAVLSGARQFYYVDQTRPSYQECPPKYEPCALHVETGMALVHDRLIELAPRSMPKRREIPLGGVEWSSVTHGDFSIDGSKLILTGKDSSLSIYDLKKQSITHRFLPVPGSRGMAASNDARLVYVLREDGRLEEWQFAAFGQDGWAASK